MNFNYPGSISEYNMNFSSSVDIVVNEKNELFNAISIYMPLSDAAENIVDFDPDWVSIEKPAVFTCTLENYTKYMKGDLLSQWLPVFTQSQGFDVILYIVVFADGADTDSLWEYGTSSISFKPITEAFSKLYFVSYAKTMFDKTYDGRGVGTTVRPGTRAAAQITLTNNSSDPATVPAGTHTFNDGLKDWEMVVDNDIILPPNNTATYVANAITAGADAVLAIGDTPVITGIPGVFSAEVISFAQGTNEGTVPIQSKYFDYALALANMCKQDTKLSYCLNMVKISYVNEAPNPGDPCHIRIATKNEEEQQMTSIALCDRTRYFWGALLLSGCTQNSWTVVHSEPVNIIPLILAAWFDNGRNSSGQFVGNKLSLLRLKGSRIKPCGYPSWLNSEVNVNESRDGIDLFKSKNVGFLRTISDNTPQESCIDSARSIDGIPVGAQMISKWVDYTSAQECARFITAEGTVTDPVLNNDAAYKKIQAIVFSNLLRFTGMGRLTNVELKFPPFEVAKIGARELRAARAWQAVYSDDLDRITITGGIIA